MNLHFSFSLSRNPSVALTCCRSLFCLPPPSSLLTLSPVDPALTLTITHTHTHAPTHLHTFTHTDPCSDPHPSPSLSLLYLYISTSIGYTCNLATEQSEDPPLPARCSDCWTRQPIILCWGSSTSQSNICYYWELPPCSPPF